MWNWRCASHVRYVTAQVYPAVCEPRASRWARRRRLLPHQHIRSPVSDSMAPIAKGKKTQRSVLKDVVTVSIALAPGARWRFRHRVGATAGRAVCGAAPPLARPRRVEEGSSAGRWHWRTFTPCTWPVPCLPRSCPRLYAAYRATDEAPHGRLAANAERALPLEQLPTVAEVGGMGAYVSFV